MPVLDILTRLSAAEKAEFDAALPAARGATDKLPFVRVLVVNPDGAPEERAERERRKQQHIDDALRDGRLRPQHESERSRVEEDRLRQKHALYFHAGRTHKAYGMMALVFEMDVPGVKATPFGLGGLFCNNGSAAAPHPCVAPVAHDWTDEKKAAFVETSSWAEDWRDKATQYLAAYFGANLRRYFGEGEKSKPAPKDPEGIFGDIRTQDWRAWTIELRVFDDVDLLSAAQSGSVIRCALDRSLFLTLEGNALARGRGFADLYPVLHHLTSRERAGPRGAAIVDTGDDLPELPDPADTHNYGKLFERLDQWVADRVLGTKGSASG